MMADDLALAASTCADPVSQEDCEAARRDVDRWLQWMRVERRYSPHTLAAGRRDLNRLINWISATRKPSLPRQQSLFSLPSSSEPAEFWKSIVASTLRTAMGVFHREGLAPRSLQRWLSSVRRFYIWMALTQPGLPNPAEGLRAPRVQKRLPDTVDIDVLNRALDVPPDDTDVLSLRDHAIAELFYSSGARLSELWQLDTSCVAGSGKGHDRSLPAASRVRDASAGTPGRGLMIEVLGKGMRQRLIPVGRKARDALQRWLDVRHELAEAGEPALFVSRLGTRLSRRSIQQRIEEWARVRGLPLHLHPHLLRHSFASHLLESGSDLVSVKEFLGHANLNTTQIYTHLDFQHLAKVYDRAHPRSGRVPGRRQD